MTLVAYRKCISNEFIPNANNFVFSSSLASFLQFLVLNLQYLEVITRRCSINVASLSLISLLLKKRFR